jgi:hypothetical protein
MFSHQKGGGGGGVDSGQAQQTTKALEIDTPDT